EQQEEEKQEEQTQQTNNNDIVPHEQQEEEYTGSLVGFTAETLKEIYEAYKKHAKALGFGVRQYTTRRIRSKEYVCAKEGFRCSNQVKKTPPPPQQKPGKKKRKPRQLPKTRTGCKAFIRAKLNKEEMFEIVEHVLKHNHELTEKNDNTCIDLKEK
ncbi:Protein FAR1-RELATED SEQUENCE 6, partial [Bienertia sinuspersici]